MDRNKLIDEITATIMQRLANEGQPPKVAVFGDVPSGFISGGCEIHKGSSPADAMDCDYIVLTAESFRAFHHIPEPAKKAEQPEAAEPKGAQESGRVIDLRGSRLVHEMDLRSQNLREGDVVKADENAIITALALDYIKNMGALLRNK